MAGTHAALKIKHIATNIETALPVVVKSYTQTATPNFNSTAVYGRPDPIVTYQNTVRTFQCTMHTCPYSEITKIDQSDLPNLMGYSGPEEDYIKSLAPIMASIYQMMYPALEYRTDGGVGVYQLKGPPLLRLQIAGILQSMSVAGAGAQELLFVPETFQVTKLADTNLINLVINGPADLKYLVPADGYSFTLGGTILHVNQPPGFVVDNSKSGNKYTFTDPGFPFGIQATPIVSN